MTTARLCAIAIMMTPMFASAAPVTPSTVRVIDGDTVAMGRDHYRLVGFDAPERGDRAQCPAERELADRATARLRQLIATGGADLREVKCSCRPGTEGRRACNYGRKCGTLTVGGRDVGPILIGEGLARPYAYSWRHHPPPATWCTEAR